MIAFKARHEQRRGAERTRGRWCRVSGWSCRAGCVTGVYVCHNDLSPHWQAWLRERKPPTLVVWGRNDPSFVAAGGEAFKRDLPDAEVHLLDAGHFALDEKNDEIASLILKFLVKHCV
ncbi:MAG: alpha/beta fold hydrolase [Bradyrhizobium sp.]